MSYKVKWINDIEIVCASRKHISLYVCIITCFCCFKYIYSHVYVCMRKMKMSKLHIASSCEWVIRWIRDEWNLNAFICVSWNGIRERNLKVLTHKKQSTFDYQWFWFYFIREITKQTVLNFSYDNWYGAFPARLPPFVQLSISQSEKWQGCLHIAIAVEKW